MDSDVPTIKILYTDTLLIAAISVFCYADIYQFQVGYCKALGIPETFITITKEEFFTTLGVLASFMLVPFCAIVLVVTSLSRSHRLGFITGFVLVVLSFTVLLFQYVPRDYRLTALYVWIGALLLVALFTKGQIWKHFRNYSHAPLELSRFVSMKFGGIRIPGVYFAVLMIGFMGFAFAEQLGKAHAMNPAVLFTVKTGGREIKIVKKYGEYLFGYDVDANETSHDLQILPVSKAEFISSKSR